MTINYIKMFINEAKEEYKNIIKGKRGKKLTGEIAFSGNLLQALVNDVRTEIERNPGQLTFPSHR